MHALLHILAAQTSTTAPGAKSSGSSLTLFIPLVLIAGLYLLFIRPRSRKARQAQAQQKRFDVGDEVVSIGGIAGRVVGGDDDEVEVEVSPGVVLTFLRRAVNARNPTPPAGGAGVGRGGGFFRPRPAPAGPGTSDPGAGDGQDDDEFAGADFDDRGFEAAGGDGDPAPGASGPAGDGAGGEASGANGVRGPGSTSESLGSRRRRDKRLGRGGGGDSSAGGR
ncbi:MAG: preprotein translocase subunit YajC [Acidimicrobiales bacterium]